MRIMPLETCRVTGQCSLKELGIVSNHLSILWFFMLRSLVSLLFISIYQRRTWKKPKIILDRLPKVRSTTGVYATEGEILSLTCSIPVFMYDNFTIKWALPKPNENAIKSSQMSNVSTRPDVYQIVSSLTINSVAMDDGGYYRCDVIEGTGNRHYSDGVFIEILSESTNVKKLWAKS